tara:strand:+ start:951 stop:1481 length:531 start_codon:yes stop_codon:yes gene_type:complete
MSVYNENDYNSNDGMLTSIWGPPMWHVMHTISFNYPVNPSNEDKKYYRNFILNLKNVLPCGHCRKNLKKNFKTLPLTMKHMASRKTFSKYVFDLHNLVNKMLGKSTNLTYCEIRERYEHFRSRCVKNDEVTKIKELGCVKPLYGNKAKCVLEIVPQTKKCKSLKIHASTRKRRKKR